MKNEGWIDIADQVSDINSAYSALVSLLAWNTKELTETERHGVHVINNTIFDYLKSTIEDMCRLGRITKTPSAPVPAAE